jgi:hypothetical protein
MTDKPSPDKKVPGTAHRLLAAELDHAAAATERGAYGAPILALALAVAFCQVQALGKVDTFRGAVFVLAVLCWTFVARAVVKTYLARSPPCLRPTASSGAARHFCFGRRARRSTISRC